MQLPLTASSYEVSVISPYSTITNRTNGTDITMELTVVSDIYYVLVQLVNGKNQLDLYFNVSHNSCKLVNRKNSFTFLFRERNLTLRCGETFIVSKKLLEYRLISCFVVIFAIRPWVQFLIEFIML